MSSREVTNILRKHLYKGPLSEVASLALESMMALPPAGPCISHVCNLVYLLPPCSISFALAKMDESELRVICKVRGGIFRRSAALHGYTAPRCVL